MLPSGIASASLDLFNAAPADPGKPSVHAVPSHGVRAAPRRMPDTAVSAHALHAATCRIDVLGTDAFVLARVLQSGTELEVRVLGSEQEPAPTSFTFAAPLLANVGVFQDAQTSEVHLLAVTHAGMLCRLRIPLTTLLRGTRLPSGWASEWAIEGLNASSNALEATSVHAVDAGLVLVACADGSLLQLRQSITSEGFVGAWRESSMRPASFLSGVSRLFQRGVMASPSRAAQRTAPTQTLALASHVREDGTALAFCVCRDRKLRVWNLISESCVRTIDLPLSFSATGAAAEVEERDSDAFERTSAPLVQLFTPSDDDTYALYLLVFVPAPLPHGAFVAAYGIELEESASWSGGVGEMALVWGKSCDARTQTADVELRDMALTRDGEAWRVWLLWHAGGAPLLQHTLALGAPSGEEAAATSSVARLGPPPGEVWTSIAPYAQYAPLRGPDFDAALAAHGKLPDAKGAALQNYTARRSADVRAIQLLAQENYTEMRSKVVRRDYQLRKWLDGVLSRTLPAGTWKSLYEMVTFSNMGYATARRTELRQQRILRDTLSAAGLTVLWVASWAAYRVCRSA